MPLEEFAMHIHIMKSGPADDTIDQGDRIQRKWFRGIAQSGGQSYSVEGTLFRRHKVGQLGYIGATPWQFGTFGGFSIKPEPDDDTLIREIAGHIVEDVNTSNKTDAMRKAMPEIQEYSRFEIDKLWRTAYGFSELLKKQGDLGGEDSRFQEWMRAIDELLEARGLSASDRGVLATALNNMQTTSLRYQSLLNPIFQIMAGLKTLIALRGDQSYKFKPTSVPRSRYLAFIEAAIRIERKIDTIGTPIKLSDTVRLAKLESEDGRRCLARLVDDELAWYRYGDDGEEFQFLHVEDAQQALDVWKAARARGEDMLTESLQISIPGTLPSGDYVEIVQGLAKKYGIDSAKAYITHEEVFVELASEGDDEAAFQQAVENMKRILPEALSRRRVDQGGGNSLHIGGNAAGSVIVLGDHNISKLEHHRLALPHPQSVDILAVLAEIRRLLTSLPGPDQRRVERALEEAVEEAETPEPRKDVIGESLEKAIVLAGKAESFAIKAAALKPHLIAAAAWLGQAWYKLAQ